MPGVTTAYQTGNHAGRPANGAGCILYSCTTHALVYRDDGTSWVTFLALGGGTPAAHAASHQNGGSDEIDVTGLTGAGGGGVTVDEFGTTAAGASWEAFTASRTLHKKITVSNVGRLLSVAAYVKGDASGVRSWGVGLFDDNSNAPGKLIAAHVPKDTSLFMSATGRWFEMPLACPVAATVYWVALLMQADTNISIGYDTGGSDPRSSNSGQWFSDGLSMTDTTRNYSIHASVLRT